MLSELYYHTRCHSEYCAVKRKFQEHDDDSPGTSSTSKILGSKSIHPKSDTKGVLVPSCILCSTKKKRNSGPVTSYETLHKVVTLQCSKTLVDRAKEIPDSIISQRIIGLCSQDLVAKEVHYHNSCKLSFLKKASVEASEPNKKHEASEKKKHEAAFSNLIPYIDTEIMTKKVPQYVFHLKALYKEQYKEL